MVSRSIIELPETGMAQIAWQWWGSHKAQCKSALGCVLLSLAAAALLTVFGYVLFTCLSMEGIHPHVPLQSIAEIFRRQ